jgi:hypothetical protein
MKKLFFVLCLLVSFNVFAWNKRIDLINSSSFAIVSFYASNVGTTSWEEDILGRTMLLPGEYATINLEDGTGYCHFDFKVETFGAGTIYRKNINVCEISSYTLQD